MRTAGRCPGAPPVPSPSGWAASSRHANSSMLRCSNASARARGERLEGGCWAEARIKIARMTLTIKLDRNWSSFQLANSAPPLSVTDSAIAPSARMQHAHAKGKASHLKMTTVRFRQLFQKNVSHLLKANHCTSILHNNELRQVDCSAALSWDPKVPQKLRKSH